MNTTKKNLILIAISVGIIACICVIMAILVQNKSAATSLTCPVHGTSFLIYTENDDGTTHTVKCQSCSSTLGTESCLDYTEWKTTTTQHYKKCSRCGRTWTSETHNFSNGTCVCGTTCPHSNVTATTVNSDYHKVTCSDCGQVIIEMEAHTWNSSNKCIACGATQSQQACTNHQITTGTDNGDGTHTGTCPNCNNPITETHNFVNGTCAVCGATQSQQACTNHQITTGTDNGDGTHTGTCPNCNNPITEAHNFVNGTCTVCGATQSQQTCTNHQITIGTDNGDGTHTGTCPNCNNPITEAHNFVNGTCTVCGATQSQQACTNHEITTGTDNGDGMHTGTCPNCSEQITEAHTGGTHSNGGTCTKCQSKYQNHSQGTTIVSYGESNETTHIAKYSCTETECTETYNVTENHNYVNGVCACGATQSQQACTNHEITTGTDNEDGTHTGTCPNCSEQITENHNYENGICTKCGKIESETCEHEYEMKYNNTMHWEKCKKCNEIKNNKKHTYIDGKCTICEYECAHTNTTTKKDNTYHWEECNDCGKELNKRKHEYTNGECTCGKKEETEECTHTNKEWIYNEKEHWQACKDCGSEIEGTKGAHNYTNGRCVCGKETTTEEEGCTHTNREWKTSETEHWQICKDCGEEIEGTRGKHVNVEGKCKNCGLQEDSKSNTKLPNTGNKAIAITMPIILVLIAFGAIKMKKYKEI